MDVWVGGGGAEGRGEGGRGDLVKQIARAPFYSIEHRSPACMYVQSVLKGVIQRLLLSTLVSFHAEVLVVIMNQCIKDKKALI